MAKHNRTFIRKGVGLVAGSLLVSTVQAGDLFQINVNNVNGAPTQVLEGGESILDLFDAFIEGEGAFTFLAGANNFSGTATYYAVPGAIQVTFNDLGAGGVVAQLSSPLTSLNENFVAGTRDELTDVIDDWFEEDGASELAALDAAISKRSAAAINDGNPFATTAEMATTTFDRFGFRTNTRAGQANATEADATGDEDAAVEDAARLTFGMGVGFSYYNATIETAVGDLDANKLYLPLEFSYGTEKWSVDLSLPLSYTEIEGSQIAGAGLLLGVPFYVVDNEETPWSWRVAPMGGVVGRASPDGANGALLYNYGLTSRLGYDVSETVRVSYGAQIGSFHDIGLTIGEIDVDRDIDQRVLVNGFQVEKLFNRFAASAHVIDTRFLEAAAVDDYQTYGGRIVYHASESFNVGVGVDYLSASVFDAVRVGISSAFSF